MKKKEIKGLAAFELLGGLDDGMIMESILPETAPTFSFAPKKRAPFMGFMNSGLAAAMAGTVVAVAVLVGMVLLWHPWSEPPITLPPDTDPGEINSSPDTADQDNTSASDTAGQDDPSAPPTYTALSVMSGGATVYPSSYMVSLEENYHDENGELHQVAADGLPARYQLGTVVKEAPHLHTGGHSFSVTLDAHEKIDTLLVYLVEDIQNGIFDREVLHATGHDGDAMMRLTELPDGEYLVVLSIFYEILYPNDEYKRGITDYAFRLTVDPSLPEIQSLSVISDGAVIYPKGYCVYVSGQQIGADGELVHFDGDGPGAANRLEEIAEEIPSLRTEGNSYTLQLPPHMSVKRLRAFSVSETQADGFVSVLDRSLALEQVGDRDPLQPLTELRDGRYIVVLNVVYSNHTSENEYKTGEDEYAFSLTVDADGDPSLTAVPALP